LSIVNSSPLSLWKLVAVLEGQVALARATPCLSLLSNQSQTVMLKAGEDSSEEWTSHENGPLRACLLTAITADTILIFMCPVWVGSIYVSGEMGFW